MYYDDEADRPVILYFIKGKQAGYAAPIVVEVEPYRSFYPAEDYHQQYLQKNPGGYCHINLGLAHADERK